MKTPRYLQYAIFSIAALLFVCLPPPAPATEYAGGFVEWTSQGTFFYDLNVPDTGTVTNVSLYINNAQTYQGFNFNTMMLISPEGTTIYLFDMSSYSITGKSLFHTRFIDSAPVIITEGIPPYAGSYRPGNSFSNFIGESMTGDWTLAIYNDAIATSNNGAVTDWTLIINQATPIPTPSPVNPTPSPVPITYREYPGSAIPWSAVGAATGTIDIANQGVVYDVNVNLSANASGGLDPIGIYLQSPEGDFVALFNKHNLSESALYLTTFDDAADQAITSGVAPYIGLYRPVESLALYNNQTMTGDWSLIVYSDTADAGEVTNWSLIIGATGYIATPTPSPTSSPVPTAPLTPTPIPTATTTPTPVGYKTPLPTPQSCYPVIPPEPEIPYTGVNITEANIYIEDDFPIDDIDVEVTAWSQGGGTGCKCCTLDSKALYLTSPNNIIVKLFGKHDLEEQGLYLTYFDDDADVSILNDIAPYYGPHQPVGLLDKFRQEGTWSQGTWTLSWYNDCAEDTGVIEWFKLCLNRPELTPSPTIVITPTPVYSPTPTPVGFHTPTPTPTPVEIICTTYPGSFFSWTGVAVVSDTISVTDLGKVEGILVHIQELYTSGDLDDVGMYLLSPDGTNVPMFEKHKLSEHQLYLTTFREDAGNSITSGIAPYIGSYRPIGSLGNFDGRQIMGDWTLVVYNDDASSDGYVTDWDLEICYGASGPITPTPTVTPDIPTPTPSPVAASILILQSGDYDGDGTSDIGVFRPATGLWSVRSLGTSFFGQAGDIPASGDYDGDGTADLAIYRGSTSLWAVYGVTRTYFGGSGDIAVPGDYDGDGICEPGIYRGSSGLWAIRGVTRLYFGSTGDYAAPGDYDGDGLWDCAVFRPSSGLWAVNGVTRIYFGVSGDIPVPRDYDGDGSADVGIVRFAGGLWAIRSVSRFYFGASGDYPVPADYMGDGTDYPGIFRGSSGLWAIKEVTRVYHGVSGDIPVAR